MAGTQERITPSRLKIALVGYGKMGKQIDQLASSRGHEIVARIDPKGPDCAIDQKTVGGADVCIDFSHPNHVLNNIRQLAALKKNMVIGTTGWHEHIDEVKSLVNKADIAFLHGPNFAIGILLFLKMVEHACALMDNYEQFDVAATEWHHREKKDAPSGFAHRMGKEILQNMRRKTKIVTNLENPLQKDEVHISSMRCGHLPGTHTLLFDSPVESIALTHTSRGREGFAHGALIAAEWLQGKKGCYSIEDLIGEGSHA